MQVYSQRSGYPGLSQETYSQHNNNLPALVRLDKQVKGERDKEEAQYLSANCVIFTYLPGEVSKLVDDHFSKALSQSNDSDHVPLSARNLPPSFWDSNWVSSFRTETLRELFSVFWF